MCWDHAQISVERVPWQTAVMTLADQTVNLQEYAIHWMVLGSDQQFGERDTDVADERVLEDDDGQRTLSLSDRVGLAPLH